MWYLIAYLVVGVLTAAFYVGYKHGDDDALLLALPLAVTFAFVWPVVWFVTLGKIARDRSDRYKVAKERFERQRERVEGKLNQR